MYQWSIRVLIDYWDSNLHTQLLPLDPENNGCRFADDIFKRVSVKENACVLIQRLFLQSNQQ